MAILQSSWTSSLKQTALFLLLLAFVFWGSRQVNSWMGHRALEKTGLEYLPIDTALQVSRETGKPILVNFSAIWCPGCRKLDKTVFSDKSVKQLIENHFLYVRLEYDSPNDKRWFTHYGVTGFPNLKLLDHTGQVTQQLRIPKTAVKFSETLTTALSMKQP